MFYFLMMTAYCDFELVIKMLKKFWEGKILRHMLNNGCSNWAWLKHIFFIGIKIAFYFPDWFMNELF